MEMNEKTSTGIEENVAGLLCYLLGWISGLIFFLIEKENQTVRFHAMQSIVTFGGLNIIYILLMVSVIGIPLMPIVGLIGLAAWIILMIKAFQGEKFKFPITGNLAEKWVKDVKL
ncbi:DUF4870 domain-containing protein [Emcibacter nanhaiensis]|uniref:DUF4870 domain-containing protein n=2 Tax=Emcibacter nanhaiensis TaxID=1505037 RepID=A0A501PPP3_9PROT|nr:DUF4870 domain-containing protein [Emcibacter nanhaiensis]